MRTVLPGDAILPDPAMDYNNYSRTINAPPEAVWPWLVQIGKDRGGWYLPASWERLLPRKWHATRVISPEYQTLVVGDRITDYGFNAAEDWLDTVIKEDNRALVFRSDRYGTTFTWALLLESPRGSGRGQTDKTIVHSRFRGQVLRTGWQRKVLVVGGRWMDWITTAPMLAGLAERAEAHWLETKRSR
ncbi:hypothetical protein K461DRAFT_322793 [Myriangium duriaei CBS 260.36]|uniref:Uncharacterized protein n=1 Tax=Myriangium duriaei CBS 260.36 TaxID=1168546 RepID=A0A9P4MHT1_9PEZI|nr:hypothetical protein K461DRAFT_322793 [Myriangium duriaei CBS 260.36]